jgi:hypothetical protein
MRRSIHEILESAFNEIKESHEVAVTAVNFDVYLAGGMASIDYHLTGTSVDCKPCTPTKD